jgi:hypothetical protein
MNKVMRIKEKRNRNSGYGIFNEGLPIGKIEKTYEKKCRNDFRHFQLYI